MFNSTKTFPFHNIIGPHTNINGDIISEGDFRIDGEFFGNIKIKGELIVGSSGNINGVIESKSLIVSGNINATMTVLDVVILKSSSIVTGDINTKKIIIDDGAIYNGNCKMI